jgi:hypothetical protein
VDLWTCFDYYVYMCLRLVWTTVYICMHVVKYKTCYGGFSSGERVRTWFILKNKADVLISTSAKNVGLTDILTDTWQRSQMVGFKNADDLSRCSYVHVAHPRSPETCHVARR